MPTHGDGSYLGTSRAAAAVSAISGRSPRRSTGSAIRRAAADRAELRGFLGDRAGLAPADRAAEISGGVAARVCVAGLRGAPRRQRWTELATAGCCSTWWSAAIRSRTGATASSSRHDERYARTASSCTSGAGCWPASRSTSTASTSRSRTAAAVRAGAEAGSAALFRRLVRCRQAVAAEQVDKYLTWGEPLAQVAEKTRAVRSAAPRERPQAELRHPAALHRSRDRGRGVGGGRRADQPSRRRQIDKRAELLPGDGFGRPAPHGANCMAAAATSWWSGRTCGPASGWCAAAPARRLSATRNRWPSA